VVSALCNPVSVGLHCVASMPQVFLGLKEGIIKKSTEFENKTTVKEMRIVNQAICLGRTQKFH